MEVTCNIKQRNVLAYLTKHVVALTEILSLSRSKKGETELQKTHEVKIWYLSNSDLWAGMRAKIIKTTTTQSSMIQY